MAKLNVYSIRNSLSCEHKGLYLLRTDKEAGRFLYSLVQSLFPQYGVDECLICRHGTFDNETGQFDILPQYVPVSWNPRGTFEGRSIDKPSEEVERDMEQVSN